MRLRISRYLQSALFAIFATLFSYQVAYAFDEAQIRELEQQFKRTTEEQAFYHWTSFSTGLRWMKQGYIDNGEVDFYNKSTGSKQVYGAGIYLAALSTSSASFGDFPVVMIVPKNTPIYDSSTVKKVMGRELDPAEITELGRRIPFIRNVASDWWLTHNARNTSRVTYAGFYGDRSVTFQVKSLRAMAKNLHDALAYGDSAGYLESFFHLLYYIDGISLMRALRVSPSNPWSQFEPQHFESFRSLHRKLMTVSLEDDWGTSGKWDSEETDANTWARKQVQEVIPSLFQDFYHTPRRHFRGSGIHAGGSEVNGTFTASPQELATLLNNKYLTVQYAPNAARTGFNVTYDYPDVRHIEKIKPILSPDLVAKISNYKKEDIEKDKALEGSLNRLIIEDLLMSLFKEIHGQPIKPAEFLSRYISIHPYGDANGRISRIYLQMNMAKAGMSLPPSFISDFDLLIAPDAYQKIIEASDVVYSQLVKALVQELIDSNFGKSRAPNFRTLPEFDRLIGALTPLGFTGNEKINPRFDDAINKRRFNEIFSSMYGPAWGLIPNEDFIRGVELAKKYGLSAYIEGAEAKISGLIQGLKSSSRLAADTEFLSGVFALNPQLPNIDGLKRDYQKALFPLMRKFKFAGGVEAGIFNKNVTLYSEPQQRAMMASILRNSGAHSDALNYTGQLAFAHHKLSMKALTRKLLDHRVSAKNFTLALERLGARQATGPEMNLSDQEIADILGQLDANGKIAFISRISLGAIPIDMDRVKIIQTAIDALANATTPSADLARQSLSTDIASLLRYSSTLENKNEAASYARLLMQLYLKADSKNQFALLSLERSPAVEEAMARVLVNQTPNLKALPPGAYDNLLGYLQALIASDRPLDVDRATLQLIVIHELNLRKQLSMITWKMKAKHIGSPLYGTLLKVIKSSKLDQAVLYRDLFERLAMATKDQKLAPQVMQHFMRDVKAHTSDDVWANVTSLVLARLIAQKTEAWYLAARSVLAKTLSSYASHPNDLFAKPLWLSAVGNFPQIFDDLAPEFAEKLLEHRQIFHSIVSNWELAGDRKWMDRIATTVNHTTAQKREDLTKVHAAALAKFLEDDAHTNRADFETSLIRQLQFVLEFYQEPLLSFDTTLERALTQVKISAKNHLAVSTPLVARFFKTAAKMTPGHIPPELLQSSIWPAAFSHRRLNEKEKEIVKVVLASPLSSLSFLKAFGSSLTHLRPFANDFAQLVFQRISTQDAKIREEWFTAWFKNYEKSMATLVTGGADVATIKESVTDLFISIDPADQARFKAIWAKVIENEWFDNEESKVKLLGIRDFTNQTDFVAIAKQRRGLSRAAGGAAQCAAGAAP